MRWNNIWVGSPVDVRTGQEAQDALKNINDTKYWDNNYGIVKVDEDRWKQAQHYEHETWSKYCVNHSDDRGQEHIINFNNYVDVPTYLGNVVEYGCGPYTQLYNILKCGKKAAEATLLDPLINAYHSLPRCRYKLLDCKVNFVNSKAEDFVCPNTFDTAICINVLEHVLDASKVMDNVVGNLKRGGVLIFNERSYDDYDPNTVYDIGHPIRVKSDFLKKYFAGFDLIYNNNNPHNHYIIARKL